MTQFLHLKCAGDVLNALGHPVQEPEREVVRAMACLRVLRTGVRRSERNAHTNERHFATLSTRENGPKVLAPVRLVEIGTQNAALAILAAHVLPYKEVIVFGEDTLKGPRLFDVARLSFRRGNIYEDWIEKHIHDFDTPVVLVSSHATPAQAERAIDLYDNVANVEQLVLLLDRTEAWNGNGVRSRLLAREIGATTAWAVEKATELRADVFRDPFIPKHFGPRVILHARSRRLVALKRAVPLSTREPYPVPAAREEHDGAG